MPPEAHALLSASAAERWLHCTAAPRLEATLPDSGSEYAAEGSLAHAIAELKLRKALIAPIGPKKFANALKEHQNAPLYNPEMLTHADAYVDYVKGVVHSFPAKPYIAAEVRCDLSSFIPEGFGTSDCIIIGGNDLYVIDYKYGRGVQVEAENNPQMMLYALGALEANSLLYDIRTVHMVIFQPRLDHLSMATIERDTLMDWGVFTVRPKAKAAFKGPGEFHAGDWCRFCRARGRCKIQAEQQLEVFKDNQKDPALMGAADFARVLPLLANMTTWANQVNDAALDRLLAGESIPGYKVVEGRSVRQWSDQEAAFEAIAAAGTPREMLYERKPISLSAAEKVLGKSEFEKLAGAYVIKPPGKPCIALESDRRPVYTGGSTAVEDFGQ